MTRSIILVLLLGVAVTGCNTTRGVGEDVQSVGRGIENATR